MLLNSMTTGSLWQGLEIFEILGFFTARLGYAREFDLEAHTLFSKRESYNPMIALPET